MSTSAPGPRSSPASAHPGRSIDLNADLGEGCAGDHDLLGVISSANVACGGHAGDDESMADTCRHALAHGVTIGAHVSYVDRHGFGRVPVDVEPAVLADQLTEQIHALQRVLDRLGGGQQVRFVKPHGALYHRIVSDAGHASAVVEALARCGNLPLVCLGHGLAATIAARSGLGVVAEAFADRAYTADGTLVDRSRPGAVLVDGAAVAGRAVEMVTTGMVTSVEGRPVPIDAQTLCIHGDTPGAVDIARRVRAALLAAGVTIASPYGPGRNV